MAGPLVLAGKYALLRRLGRGGMAEVYLAKQMGLAGFEKLVVVKRTLPSLAGDEQFKEMFLDEARTAADLRHPNIVSVLEVGEDRGQLFLVMEFLHGRDVGQILQRSTARWQLPPLARSLQIVAGVAAGLDYAHGKTALDGAPLRLVHRDVSPQNIVVTYDGEPKLVDFGIARAESRSHRTHDGSLRGKVGYIAPEQIEGAVADGRADQFALGVVLYELTTLRPLFRRSRPMDSLQAILGGEVQPPSELVPGYPPVLEQVVMRALATDPADRFPDCGAFLEALERVAERSRYSLNRRRTGSWLRRIFADEVEDDRSLAHMPTLEHLDEDVDPEGARSADDDASPDDVFRQGETRPIDEEREALATTEDRRRPAPTLAEPELPLFERPFLGRSELLAKIGAALDGGAPLLTLHGAHGTGKTRVAVEAARTLHLRGDVAARFIDLREARSAEEVCAGLASPLRVGLLTGATLQSRADQVGRALAALATPERRPLLLLDDHPLLEPAAVAALFERWLHLAPSARFLITAPAPLGLDLETPLLVEGLPVPTVGASAAEVLACEAGQLFVEAAREEQPDFILDEQAAPAVIRVLREVAGAPLAVELAASRLADPEADWEEEVPTRTVAKEAAPEGLSTLSAAVDQAVRWSLCSLSPEPRQVVIDASVFVGGFSLELAERVVHLGGRPDGDALAAHLDHLRARALVRTFEPAGLPGTLRWELVPTLHPRLRAVAEEREHADGRRAVEDRHADAVLEDALSYARHIDGPGGTRLFARLAAEIPNLLAVLARSLARRPRESADVDRALKATLAIDPVLTANGYTDAQLALVDDAIEAGRQGEPAPGLMAFALECRADAFKARGALERAAADYEEALALARAADDTWFAGLVHRNLADVLNAQGDAERAREESRRALKCFRQIGDRHFEARAHLTLGRALRLDDDRSGAARHLAAALDIFRHVGDRRFEGRALAELGRLQVTGSSYERAVEVYEVALRVHREVGDQRSLAATLTRLGALLRRLGRHAEAGRRLDDAGRIARQIGNRRAEGRACYERGLLEGARGALEEMKAQLEEAAAIQSECGDRSGLLATEVELSRLQGRRR